MPCRGITLYSVLEWLFSFVYWGVISLPVCISECLLSLLRTLRSADAVVTTFLPVCASLPTVCCLVYDLLNAGLLPCADMCRSTLRIVNTSACFIQAIALPFGDKDAKHFTLRTKKRGGCMQKGCRYVCKRYFIGGSWLGQTSFYISAKAVNQSLQPSHEKLPLTIP
jgi:hypothetical protein